MKCFHLCVLFLSCACNRYSGTSYKSPESIGFKLNLNCYFWITMHSKSFVCYFFDITVNCNIEIGRQMVNSRAFTFAGALKNLTSSLLQIVHRSTHLGHLCWRSIHFLNHCDILQERIRITSHWNSLLGSHIDLGDFSPNHSAKAFTLPYAENMQRATAILVQTYPRDMGC